MGKEIRQGLGLLAIAAVCGLLAVAARAEALGPVVRLAAYLFALLGLAFLAVGLFRTQADAS